MTVSRAQQTIIDREHRARTRDYHRALDEDSREAEIQAELIPPQDLPRAAQHLAHCVVALQDALTCGDHTVAHRAAVQAAGEALGISATITSTRTTRHG